MMTDEMDPASVMVEHQPKVSIHPGRTWCRACHYTYGGSCLPYRLASALVELTAERDALQTKIDAVRKIHSSVQGHWDYPTCIGDGKKWPCTTIDALEES